MTEKWTRFGQIGKSTPLTVAGTHTIARADGTAVAYVIDSSDAHKVKATLDMFEALDAALLALAASKPTIAHYQELVRRQKDAIDKATAALSRARGETP